MPVQLKISKGENNTIGYIEIKNGKEVTNDTFTAEFSAKCSGNMVVVFSEKHKINSLPVHYTQIEVDGVVLNSAAETVKELSAFIGSFKSGGGAPTSTSFADIEGQPEDNEALKEVLDDKADIYEAPVYVNLSEIKVGDDLSGKTLRFDTSKSTRPAIFPTYNSILNLENGVIDNDTFEFDPEITAVSLRGILGDIRIALCIDGVTEWQLTELVMPEGSVVTALNFASNPNFVDATTYESDETTDVDCEYNYKKIEVLSGESVKFNQDNNIELREKTKILGKNEDSTEYELLGLAEYVKEEVISLEDITVGMNLRGLTVKFDTTKGIKFNSANTGGILRIEGNIDIIATEFTDAGEWGSEERLYICTRTSTNVIDSESLATHRHINNPESDTYEWVGIETFTFDKYHDHIVTYINFDGIILPDSEFTFADTSIKIGETVYDQVEVGSEHVHLNLNTNDDPEFGTDITVDTPNGKERIAYRGKVITDLPVEVTSDATWNNASLYTSGDCEITLTDAIPVGGRFDLTKYAEGIVTVKCTDGLTLNREHTSLIIPDIDQAVAI
ncbi:hypothetical protein D0T49_01890, partial [Paludibacter sp. 221]|uniref:hypothetical protein n=1 Tax=Paludibacter sp. 221 TaxID=2302939 RepID=UPI0013D458D5